MGGIGGGLLAGLGSDAVDGAAGATFNHGNILKGAWKGGLTGFTSTGVSVLIGGGAGAIAGGFIGGSLGSALNGGDFHKFSLVDF